PAVCQTIPKRLNIITNWGQCTYSCYNNSFHLLYLMFFNYKQLQRYKSTAFYVSCNYTICNFYEKTALIRCFNNWRRIGWFNKCAAFVKSGSERPADRKKRIPSA